MARKLFTTVSLVIESFEVDDDAGAASAPKTLKHRWAYEKSFESGTTNGTQLDRVWSTDADNTTTPQDADLHGGLNSVLDSGLAVAFPDLCVVAIANDEASGGDDINVGAGTNPVDTMWLAAGDGTRIKPQGCFVWIAPDGITITAATNDILRLVASAGTVPKRALIAGRSA